MSLAQKLRQTVGRFGDRIGRCDRDGIETLLMGFGGEVSLKCRRIAI